MQSQKCIEICPGHKKCVDICLEEASATGRSVSNRKKCQQQEEVSATGRSVSNRKRRQQQLLRESYQSLFMRVSS
jgi:hypothetical protein